MSKYINILLLLFAVSAKANIAIEQIKEINRDRQAQTGYLKQHAMQQELSKNYYFVFIYRSTCPHCHKFAPVVKNFSRAFSLDVKAYATDSLPIKEFDGEPLTAELYQTYYLNGGYRSTVPALYLVNKENQQAYPVLFGEAEPFQLASRMIDLMKQIKEQYNA